MSSIYDEAVILSQYHDIIPAQDVTYVNRGSNTIPKKHHNDVSESIYLFEVLKRITGASDVDNLQKLALANVRNEYFPPDSWGSVLAGSDYIIIPGIQHIKDALYINIPSDWISGSFLSTTTANDDHLDECNDNPPEPEPRLKDQYPESDPRFSRYMNELNQCVPRLSFWKAEDSKKDGLTLPGAPIPKNTPDSGGPLKFEASKSDEMPKFEADFSASLRRKKSDEPGVEEKGVEEDGSNTLLYIAGAGVLGAIVYYMLKSKK